MYIFESRIRYSETDENGVLTMGGLLNYFQDCSTFQSEELGLGMDYMRERHLAWVVNAWQIEAERLPRLGERVKIGTLPYEFRGFMGQRNFVMIGEDGSYLAKANSIWSLINLSTGRLVAALPEMLEKYVLEEKIPMEYADRKIAVPEDGEEKEPILIGPQHLDMNHHVNNGQYIALAAAYLPEKVRVLQMRAEYKKQAFQGDLFYPYVVREDDRLIISFRDADKKIFASVEFQIGNVLE